MSHGPLRTIPTEFDDPVTFPFSATVRFTFIFLSGMSFYIFYELPRFYIRSFMFPLRISFRRVSAQWTKTNVKQIYFTKGEPHGQIQATLVHVCPREA